MKLSARLRSLFVPMLLGAAALAAGCTQGVGDRCQLDGDCNSGLVCSLADMTCQDPVTQTLDGGGLPDAFPHVDANLTPDASPPDAVIDVSTVGIDAPAAVDASVIDAPAIDAPPGGRTPHAPTPRNDSAK